MKTSKILNKAPAERLTVTDSSTESAALTQGGRYVIRASNPVYFRQGDTGGTAVATDAMLLEGELRRVRVHSADQKYLQFLAPTTNDVVVDIIRES